MKNPHILILLTLILMSCGTAPKKIPGSIDIPRSKYKVKIKKNAELNYINKMGDDSFYQMYLEEAVNLKNQSVRSNILDKYITILAHGPIEKTYGELGFRIPLGQDDKMDCYLDASKEQRIAITNQTLDFFKQKGYQSFQNINNVKKTSFYKEYILFKMSGKKRTFGMFISRFKTIKHPEKNRDNHTLFCTHDGSGMRNTMATIMRQFAKQL
ncbi:MAG: hypothetical protein HN576_01015 [Bacteriovoracaceae bacterium]|jgi:hypothetical protein|nr:hypothetical protein [Bacteriovoracaceae bacterium]